MIFLIIFHSLLQLLFFSYNEVVDNFPESNKPDDVVEPVSDKQLPLSFEYRVILQLWRYVRQWLPMRAILFKVF